MFVQTHNFDCRVIFTKMPKFLLTLNVLSVFRLESKLIPKLFLLTLEINIYLRLLIDLNLEISLHNASNIV